MGVYINMEIPKFCDACPFACWSNLHQTGSCYLLDSEQCFDDYSTEYRTKRSEHCPLIKVPEPHGRLIDADALDTSILQAGFSYAITRRKLRYTPGEVRQKIANAPTVIPASEEET